ncbi:MAG: hypothetical protein IT385_14835 [Deltaproteobacteria bacterium]|nr:hypothetical protein [Deltaproteobacteria bacterium]
MRQRPADRRRDAAQPELAGDVGARVTGGVIRYRSWPAKRHPMRLFVAAVLVVLATAVTAVVLKNVFWASVVFVGLAFLASAFFFPTEVALDGDRLVVRRLGQPRSYELRSFRRIETSGEVLARVELLHRARLSSVDPLDGIVLPLPEQPAMAEQVLAHLRRWVGRTPTGRFKIDVDHAPEDDV